MCPWHPSHDPAGSVHRSHSASHRPPRPSRRSGGSFHHKHRRFCRRHIQSKRQAVRTPCRYLDCGIEAKKSDFDTVYHEREDRIHIGNSKHDIEHGCYITGADPHFLKLQKQTLLYGNMQDEAYFGKYRKEIKQWLCVNPLYDCKEYSRENLCIFNNTFQRDRLWQWEDIILNTPANA